MLDTGTVFDFLANRSYADSTEFLLRESRAAISAITVFELFNGVRNKAHIEQRENLVSLLEVVDITSHVARRASEVYTQLRSAGQRIDNEDILVAACALHKGYPLLTTNNRHFQKIPALLLARI